MIVIEILSRIWISAQVRLLFCLLPLSLLLGHSYKFPPIQEEKFLSNWNNTQFTRLNDTGNYQIKVFVDYTVTDPALIGQKINAVMKVYNSDGSLLKTTSFPGGFAVNRTGGTYLLTSIPIPPAQNITTETVFTDLNKTNLLSNPVKTTPHMTDL